MPQFAPGEVKAARAPLTVKPSGLSCSAELYLVSDGAKAATSGTKPFTSTGAKQDISFPVTMPDAQGTYPVYLDVFVADQLIAAYKATEDVVIKYPKGITILKITGEKLANGSISAHIYWTYHGISIDREAFASVVTSIGRMENGVWKNYYTVETFPGIPPEGGIGVAGAGWAPEAVAQMPKGPAGFRSGVTIYLYWQPQAWSAPFIAEDVVVI